LRRKTEEQITKLTFRVLDGIASLTKYSIEQLKRLYPFHAIFFPEESLPYAKQERSIVTRIGIMFYPPLAEIVARERYSLSDLFQVDMDCLENLNA